MPPTLARAIFYAIESTRGRREMLLSLGVTLFAKASEQTILDDILRRVGKASSQRNKYVHDAWGVAQTAGREIFQLRLSEKGEQHAMQEITIPDMQATVKHVNKLADELVTFKNRIAPMMPALLEKHRKQPGLALVFGKKGHPPGRSQKGFTARSNHLGRY